MHSDTPHRLRAVAATWGSIPNVRSVRTATSWLTRLSSTSSTRACRVSGGWADVARRCLLRRAFPERARDHGFELRTLHRLREPRAHAELGGFRDPITQRAQHDAQARAPAPDLAQLFEEADAVDLRHLVVEQDDIERLALGTALRARARPARAESALTNEARRCSR